MTYHKFTDEEIIKALECCSKSPQNANCKDCCLREFGDFSDECQTQLMKIALVLIKVQKAEIERLKKGYIPLRRIDEVCKRYDEEEQK